MIESRTRRELGLRPKPRCGCAPDPVQETPKGSGAKPQPPVAPPPPLPLARPLPAAVIFGQGSPGHRRRPDSLHVFCVESLKMEMNAGVWRHEFDDPSTAEIVAAVIWKIGRFDRSSQITGGLEDVEPQMHASLEQSSSERGCKRVIPHEIDKGHST